MTLNNNLLEIINNIESININELNDIDLSNIYALLDKLSKLYNNYKKAILKRIEQNGECGGYNIKLISGGKDINTEKAWELMSNNRYYKMPINEFFNVCKISINDLKQVFIDSLMLNNTNYTQIVSESIFDSITAQFITDKQPRRVIVKNNIIND